MLLGGENHKTLVVRIDSLDVFLDEHELRVLAHELNLAAQSVDVLVERLLVFARSIIVEIEHLEHGLEVFRRAVAAEALSLAANVGADAQVGALQFLAELAAVELSDTSVVDKLSGCLSHVGLVVLIDRGTALGERAHADFVSLIVGLLDDEADAVGAGVFGVVESLVLLGHLGGDGGEVLAEERLVLEVIDPRGGLGAHSLLVEFQGSLLAGDLHLAVGGEPEDEVLVGNPTLNHSVHLVEGDFRHKFVSVAVFLTDAGDNLVLEEVVGVFLSEADALSLVLLLGHLLVAAQEFLFLAVEFGLEEAVLIDAAHLGEEHLDSLIDFAVLGGALYCEGVARAAEEGLIAGAGLDEGRAGFLTYFVETVTQHAVDELADKAVAVVTHGALRSLVVFPEHSEAGAGGFLVGSDSDEGFFVLRDVEVGTRTRVLDGLAAREVLLHFGFHLVDVDVANDDDGLHVRTIPVFVETHDDVALEVADDFLLADGETQSILRAFQQDGEGGFLQTFAGAEAATPFLDDDATLVFNLLRGEEQLACPAVEDFETHLDHIGLVARQIDIIDGLVESRPGVDAAAKLDTVLLQLADHLVALVVLGTVEGHVLTEVGKTLLVLVLEHRTSVGHQTELHAVFGFLVGADVVGQPVVELTNLYLFVDGHLLGEVHLFLLAFLLCLSEQSGAAYQGEKHQ